MRTHDVWYHRGSVMTKTSYITTTVKVHFHLTYHRHIAGLQLHPPLALLCFQHVFSVVFIVDRAVQIVHSWMAPFPIQSGVAASVTLLLQTRGSEFHGSPRLFHTNM